MPPRLKGSRDTRERTPEHRAHLSEAMRSSPRYKESREQANAKQTGRIRPYWWRASQTLDPAATMTRLEKELGSEGVRLQRRLERSLNKRSCSANDGTLELTTLTPDGSSGTAKCAYCGDSYNWVKTPRGIKVL